MKIGLAVFIALLIFECGTASAKGKHIEWKAEDPAHTVFSRIYHLYLNGVAQPCYVDFSADGKTMTIIAREKKFDKDHIPTFTLQVINITLAANGSFQKLIGNDKYSTAVDHLAAYMNRLKNVDGVAPSDVLPIDPTDPPFIGPYEKDELADDVLGTIYLESAKKLPEDVRKVLGKLYG